MERMRENEKLLTYEEVREMFDCDPEKGILIWKNCSSSKPFNGTVAGHLDKSNGYVNVTVNGRKYNRTTRYKCLNQHITYKQETITIDLDKKPDRESPILSINRYHKKGFKGHKVNKPKEIERQFPPNMTNSQRMYVRRLMRFKREEQERENAKQA